MKSEYMQSEYNRTVEALNKREAIVNIANDIIDNELTTLIVMKAKQSLGTPTVGDLENIYQQIKLNL